MGGSSKPPMPRERVAHLALLLLELALVGQHLPGRAGVRASAPRCDRAPARAARRRAPRRSPLRFDDPGAHAVAGDRAAHEDHVAVGARHAVPAEGERVDVELELVAGAGRARWRGRAPYARSRGPGAPIAQRRRSSSREHRPRVLPALRRAQARVRDRGDLRAARRLFSREAVDALRDGRRPRRCSSSPLRATSAGRRRREEAELARVEAALELEVDGETIRTASPRWCRRTSPTRSGVRRSSGAQRARRQELNPLHARDARAHARARARAGLAELPRDVARSCRASTCARWSGRPPRSSRRPRSGTSASSSRSCGQRSASASTGCGARISPAFFRAPRSTTRSPRSAWSRARADARRTRDRPARPGQVTSTPSAARRSRRARSAPGPRAGGGVPRDRAGRWPRRLRGAVPRGGPHGALRARRRVAAVRAPLPRRQLGHRGLRVPLPEPDGRPRLAGRRAGRRGPRSAIVAQTRAGELVFLRRYAAKLGYELELHGDGAADGLPASLRAAAVGGRARGVAHRDVALRRGRVLLRRRATCARGRWRRTCGAALRERFGDRWLADARGGRPAARDLARGPARATARSSCRR